MEKPKVKVDRRHGRKTGPASLYCFEGQVRVEGGENEARRLASRVKTAEKAAGKATRKGNAVSLPKRATKAPVSVNVKEVIDKAKNAKTNRGRAGILRREIGPEFAAQFNEFVKAYPAVPKNMDLTPGEQTWLKDLVVPHRSGAGKRRTGFRGASYPSPIGPAPPLGKTPPPPPFELRVAPEPPARFKWIKTPEYVGWEEETIVFSKDGKRKKKKKRHGRVIFYEQGGSIIEKDQKNPPRYVNPAQLVNEAVGRRKTGGSKTAGMAANVLMPRKKM